MAFIGQAYNLKVASDEVIRGYKIRNGTLAKDGHSKNGGKKSKVMFGQQVMEQLDMEAKEEVVEEEEEAEAEEDAKESTIIDSTRSY